MFHEQITNLFLECFATHAILEDERHLALEDQRVQVEVHVLWVGSRHFIRSFACSLFLKS